ncbi:MAG: gamma-glutamyltransferase [Candidatus Bathyarchaeia archaeon]|jgi:gamma-glutamyltranspeptidase/glutathione hydrolase
MSDSKYIYQLRRWGGPGRYDCVAPNGVVASKHTLIGEAGCKMIRRGGNAIDAAVAATFMDCVVEPAMNGIGGEGVMAIHLASGENVIVDYVGRPSKDCTPNMYKLSEATEPGWMGWRAVEGDANVIGHKACVTPGTVAGLIEALERHGSMKLPDVMAPAISIAEEGFPVGWWTAGSIFQGMKTFWHLLEWRKIFLHDSQFPYIPFTYDIPKPEMLVQKDLAKSLRAIAEGGRDAFYKGWIADAIAEEMSSNNGLISREDLAAYEPIVSESEPGRYRGHEVVYDPTHGGTTLMEMLNILEGYDLAHFGFGSPEHLHLVGDAIGLAYADRFEFMGDPGYVKVPQRALVSKSYAAELRKSMSLDKATKIGFGRPWPFEPDHTTSLAVADKVGNMVCVNQTLVNIFGSGVVVPGTGITMNNAMYGLNPEPEHANSINGRKRRIQNVCPIIVLKSGVPLLACGAPGGRNIPVAVLQVILHVIDFKMGIQEAIEAPRCTRETGRLFIDSRFSQEVREQLKAMGHDIDWVDEELRSWARPVGVLRDPKTEMLHGGVTTTLTNFESRAVGC